MKYLLTLALLFLSACNAEIKTKSEGGTDNKVSGEVVVIVRQQIDLQYTAKGLLNLCGDILKDYTGTDKIQLMDECTKKQLDTVNTLLEDLLKQMQGVPNIPLPTPTPSN